MAATYFYNVVASSHSLALFVQNDAIFVENTCLSVDHSPRFSQLFPSGSGTSKLSNCLLTHNWWLNAILVAIVVIQGSTPCSLFSWVTLGTVLLIEEKTSRHYVISLTNANWAAAVSIAINCSFSRGISSSRVILPIPWFLGVLTFCIVEALSSTLHLCRDLARVVNSEREIILAWVILFAYFSWRLPDSTLSMIGRIDIEGFTLLVQHIWVHSKAFEQLASVLMRLFPLSNAHRALASNQSV